MQISTRERDFVVDVLALRSRVRDALGRAFADPHTLKVMHGADNDVQWLQKDFGVFVSCLFDRDKRRESSNCRAKVWRICYIITAASRRIKSINSRIGVCVRSPRRWSPSRAEVHASFALRLRSIKGGSGGERRELRRRDASTKSGRGLKRWCPADVRRTAPGRRFTEI